MSGKYVAIPGGDAATVPSMTHDGQTVYAIVRYSTPEDGASVQQHVLLRDEHGHECWWRIKGT